MDVPQIPSMVEPITIPETSTVKNGKLFNKKFGNKLRRKQLFFSKQLSLFPLASNVILSKNNKKERTFNCMKLCNKIVIFLY
jgi:hypothetical protein